MGVRWKKALVVSEIIYILVTRAARDMGVVHGVYCIPRGGGGSVLQCSGTKLLQYLRWRQADRVG